MPAPAFVQVQANPKSVYKKGEADETIQGTHNLCVASVLLAACQPSPRQDGVVNQGHGQLEQKIQAAPVAAQQVEAPATLRLGSFGTKEFQVVVDAGITVPEAARYPVAQIEQRAVTTEWAGERLRIMAKGNPVFTHI